VEVYVTGTADDDDDDCILFLVIVLVHFHVERYLKRIYMKIRQKSREEVNLSEKLAYIVR